MNVNFGKLKALRPPISEGKRLDPRGGLSLFVVNAPFGVNALLCGIFVYGALFVSFRFADAKSRFFVIP